MALDAHALTSRLKDGWIFVIGGPKRQATLSLHHLQHTQASFGQDPHASSCSQLALLDIGSRYVRLWCRRDGRAWGVSCADSTLVGGFGQSRTAPRPPSFCLMGIASSRLRTCPPPTPLNRRPSSASKGMSRRIAFMARGRQEGRPCALRLRSSPASASSTSTSSQVLTSINGYRRVSSDNSVRSLERCTRALGWYVTSLVVHVYLLRSVLQS